MRFESFSFDTFNLMRRAEEHNHQLITMIEQGLSVKSRQ